MQASVARFIVGVVIGSGFAAAQSTAPLTGQWLVERVEGTWEVRSDPRGVIRSIAGRFDVLTAGSQVRCTKLPCVLEYSTDGRAARPLFAKPPRLSSWVSVPQPTETPVAPTAYDLQQMIGRIGVRGGATKDASTCGGDLPLLAPICYEVINPQTFRLVWTPRPSEAGKVLTLFVSGADSSERRRWDTISADSGALQRADVSGFLSGLQLPDRPTDVTIRLVRTETVDALRLVRLLSLAEQSTFTARLRGFGDLAELPRQLKTLEEALKMKMWSMAADVAMGLLRDAPESLEISKYALIGLCGSDYADEVARLRERMRAAGVTGICESETKRP